jgi:hemerythrin-like metal-binding protein
MFAYRPKSLAQKTSAKAAPPPPLVAWTSHISVEVKLLDNDHKKLLILLSKLHNAVIHCLARQILDRVMESLIQHIRVHFAHEEQLFAETAYPGAAFHEREHNCLIVHAKVLQQRFRNSADVESCLQVIEQLKNSLCHHMESADLLYVPHFRAREVTAILASNQALPAAMLKKRASSSRILQGVW